MKGFIGLLLALLVVMKLSSLSTARKPECRNVEVVRIGLCSAGGNCKVEYDDGTTGREKQPVFLGSERCVKS